MSTRCQVCQGCTCNLGLEDVHTGYCECRRCGGCSCNLQGSEMNRLLLAYCRCTTYQGCMCVNYYRVLPPHVVRDTTGQDREGRYPTQGGPTYQEDPNYQENPNYYQEEEYGQEPLPPPPPEQWFQAPTNGQDTFYHQSQEGSPYQAGTIHRGRNQGRQAPPPLPPSVNYRERQPQSNPSNNENPYICEQCNGCLCNRFPYIQNSNYCTCESRALCSCYQGQPPCPPPLPTYINWDDGSRVTTPSGRPPLVAPRVEHQARQSTTWGGTPGSNEAHAQQEALNPTGQQAAQRQAPRTYPAGYRQHQGAPHSYREGAYRPGYQESQVPRRTTPRANRTNAATAQQQTPQSPQANRPKPGSPYRSIG